MIENILDLLKMCKDQKINGKYIDIALGKNKFPETAKEGYAMLKKELWKK